jgi:MSHA biogenesis protein MshG
MEVFEYVGRNRRGEAMRGTVESSSPQAVATWLMETDIFPVTIKPQQRAEKPKWLSKLMGDDKVSATDLLMFTRQMANMVRSGMRVLDAVDGIRTSTPSRALAVVLRGVRDDMDRGTSLSAAFGRHPAVFDEYYVNMIRVGEETGRMTEAFQSLYGQIEFDRQMRQKMKAAMRYPMFVIVALAIALTVLTMFVIPSFAKTYQSLKVELPLLTRFLLGLSYFVVNYWWMILLALAAAVQACRLALRSHEIRYTWDKFKLRVPIVGPVARKASVARFSRSFATAIQADVPIVTAFQLVSRVVGNAFYEERILQMQKGVERGEVLSRVMRTSEIFSPLELQLVAMAEKTGEVDGAVHEIAKLYSEEVEYEVDRLTQSVEPLLLAMMGILVGILVLGIFLPMWDLGSAHFGKR